MTIEDTERVLFEELRVGDIVYSDHQEQSGKIVRIIREFRQVVLEDGGRPALEATVTIRKRR